MTGACRCGVRFERMAVSSDGEGRAVLIEEGGLKAVDSSRGRPRQRKQSGRITTLSMYVLTGDDAIKEDICNDSPVTAEEAAAEQRQRQQDLGVSGPAARVRTPVSSGSSSRTTGR